MKYALVLVAVLVATAITSHDAHASTHTSLDWSFGNYGTSELLKMSPAYVLRTEHGNIAVVGMERYQVEQGYNIVSDINGVRVNNYHKTMGEGEEQYAREKKSRWYVETFESVQPQHAPESFHWDWNLIPQPNALGSVHNF